MADVCVDASPHQTEIPPEIAKALVAIQARVKPLERTSENEEYGSSYTPLDQVATEAYKLLRRHKIAVMQPLTTLDGLSALSTILVHESGVSYGQTTKLAVAKIDPQSHMSSVTYTRRYALMAMLGLTSKDDDDDGNKASGVFLKPTDEQVEQIKSLCVAMKYPSKEIAAQLWKVKTRDHATLTIINLNKMVSERVRDNDAREAATAAENGKHIDVDAPAAAGSRSDLTIKERIERLGLKDKKTINKFVHSFTGKPMLANCTGNDLLELGGILDTLDKGKRTLPADWYAEGRAPAHAPDIRSGEDRDMESTSADDDLSEAETSGDQQDAATT